MNASCRLFTRRPFVSLLRDCHGPQLPRKRCRKVAEAIHQWRWNTSSTCLYKLTFAGSLSSGTSIIHGWQSFKCWDLHTTTGSESMNKLEVMSFMEIKMSGCKIHDTPSFLLLAADFLTMDDSGVEAIPPSYLRYLVPGTKSSSLAVRYWQNTGMRINLASQVI